MKYRGSAIIIVIIFGAVLVMSMGAIISLLIVQQRVIQYTAASEQALQIAEAGINRYRWILAHNEEDFSGADEDYAAGHYTVSVDPPAEGSNTVTVTSTGWTDQYPNVERTIRVRYGKPSLAEYAFASNTNVWIGENETIHGRLHSNGGIRIDGIVDSVVSSTKATYICGSQHGCADEEQAGIWGAGQDPVLWDFPVTDALDFDAILLDIYDMQQAATSAGVLLPDTTTYGYHIAFQNDGTFDVSEVTKLQDPAWGYDGVEWIYESNSIAAETPLLSYQNVSIPENGIIFAAGQTWVSGEVAGRATVVAAILPETTGNTADIIISDDITYYPDRLSDSVLGLIAQEDILLPLYSPDSLTIDAALLAKNGHVFRYYYYPTYYPSETLKTSVETYGTIITNDLWTWQWLDGSSSVASGYESIDLRYDPNLYLAPPPFFPSRDEYVLISWEKILQNE